MTIEQAKQIERDRGRTNIKWYGCDLSGLLSVGLRRREGKRILVTRSYVLYNGRRPREVWGPVIERGEVEAAAIAAVSRRGRQLGRDQHKKWCEALPDGSPFRRVQSARRITGQSDAELAVKEFLTASIFTP